MVSHRYDRVPENDSEHHDSVVPTPKSPPPSFYSRSSSESSRRRAVDNRRDLGDLSRGLDRTLAETFDDGEGNQEEHNDSTDDRERLLRSMALRYPGSQPRVGRETRQPREAPPQDRQSSQQPVPGATGPAFQSNDGVFANLNAKPEPGEKDEDQPPSYEVAAADPLPPYWETTILAPGVGTDDVYIDGLPVGSSFSFVWNGAISAVFQLVGFLLTYLLHTTHAAKNGSRAGLGITIIMFGYNMRRSTSPGTPDPHYGQPPDADSHDFDPGSVSDSAAAAVAASHSGGSAVSNGSWLSYLLMVIGWFVLMKAIIDYIKVRKHEQLILQSPSRGLNQPIVGEAESSERIV